LLLLIIKHLKMYRLSLLLILLFPELASSQINNEDFGNWIRTDFSYGVNKKVSFNSRFELRTINNSTEIRQLFSEFSAKVKLNSFFRTAFAYRAKSVNEEYSNIFQNRFHADLTFRYKIGELTFLIRNRAQYNLIPNELNQFFERIRIKTAYKINKKIKAFLFNEFFFHINNLAGPKYDKNRLGIGIEYKLNRSLFLGIKYLRNKELNSYNPQIINVIGLGITHKLN